MNSRGVTTKQKILKRISINAPEVSLHRGWHLDGAGPARFGWGAYYPTGRVFYLGRTLEAVARSLGIGDGK